MSLADPGRQLITFMDQQSKLHVYPNISNSFVPGRNRCPVIFKVLNDYMGAGYLPYNFSDLLLFISSQCFWLWFSKRKNGDERIL